MTTARTPRYPGWRSMTASQRHNAKSERIWQEARELEGKRIAAGEVPNPNLTEVKPAKVMTTYYLHHNQNGGIMKFGADDDSTAQTIASALLKRMTVNHGGMLYTKEGCERTTVLQFDICGGININGVHACSGGCRK